MDSKELRRRQSEQRVLDDAKGAIANVVARVTDGNLEGALHEMGDALALTDALGAAFTTSHWPVCIGCRNPGSGEVAHPTEQDGRPSLCIEARDRCAGNFYGRMHPAQLHDFIVKQMREIAERQERNRIVAEVEAGRVPVESKMLPDDLKPTPSGQHDGSDRETDLERATREDAERAVAEAEKQADKALGKGKK
jgi:hypothetical protein